MIITPRNTSKFPRIPGVKPPEEDTMATSSRFVEIMISDLGLVTSSMVFVAFRISKQNFNDYMYLVITRIGIIVSSSGGLTPGIRGIPGGAPPLRSIPGGAVPGDRREAAENFEVF